MHLTWRIHALSNLSKTSIEVVKRWMTGRRTCEVSGSNTGEFESGSVCARHCRLECECKEENVRTGIKACLI